MSRINFTVLFDLFDFSEVQMFKDPGMIPCYLKRKYGWNTSIVFYENDLNPGLKGEYNGIRLIRIKRGKGLFLSLARIPGMKFLKKLGRLKMLVFLMKNARRIDILNLYHFSPVTVINGLVYRLCNPGGFIYLKLDDDLRNLDSYGTIWDRSKRGLDIFIRLLCRKFLKLFSGGGGLISIETKAGQEKLKAYFYKTNDFKEYRFLNDCLIYLPDGVDGNELNRLFPSVKTPAEKENIIITVGRIGTKQKNSTMLMDALKGIELGDWKAYFIGPVEEHFKRFIDAYFTENPHLKDKVFFMGNIKNRKEFFSWYDRAKVFCHTSLYESFGLVLAEAAYFGDYIISTRVGAAPDILADGVPGKIIERGDAGGLMKALMGVITGETKTDPSWQVLTSLIHNNFLWEGIVEKLYNSITGLRSI